MILRVCVLILFVHYSFLLLSQDVHVRGKLLTAEDKSPIGYANIGILNTAVGTISNEDGTFEISIPQKYQSNELLFAALGFERKSFAVHGLSPDKELIVYLEEQTTILGNVTVKSKKAKPAITAEFGNQYYNEGSIYADSSAAGSAMALLIENKYPAHHPELQIPFHVLDAKLRIAHNTFDNFKVRIRFLSVDSATSLPDKDLVHHNIIVTSGMNKGWLKIPLAKYNIQLNVPSFFLVFEWLLDDEDRLMLLEQYKEFRRQFPSKVTVDTVEVDGQKITFNSWHGFRAGTSFGSSSNKFSLENYKSYFRNNSYGKWKRSSFILTARVKLANFE